MTFLIQHWLGFWGMPRRVWKYMDGQGWNLANLISSVGAFLMAIGVIVLVSTSLGLTLRKTGSERPLGRRTYA